MSSISVVIITYNEEHNIGRCLQSIQGLADEIVVVDSLSNDGTQAICEKFGVRFISKPFLGYIAQKNFAKEQATHQFILSLDADEALSKELYASIKSVKEKGLGHDIYSMNRCTNFCGRWIKHGTWYPDKKLRLFNRHKATWTGTDPHDSLEPVPGCSIAHLPGDLLHYSFYNIEELVAQANRFTTIQAQAMFKIGKKASIVKLVCNPIWAFFFGYFLKRGFLDGKDGFIIAWNVAYQTLLKYSKLMHLQTKG